MNIKLFACSLSFFLFFLFSTAVCANDAVYLGDGIDVYPLQHADIQLVSEKITITHRSLYLKNKDLGLEWQVHVDMTFKNYGADTTVQMGFPFFAGDSQSDEPINPNFRTWVDGKEVAITKKSGIPNPLQEKLDSFPEEVFTYSVTFKKGQTRNIVHTYNAGGWFDSIGHEKFVYVLRTGALWKGTIENLIIHLKIHAKQARNIHCVLPTEHGAEAKGEELTLYWKYKNYKPDNDIEISGKSMWIPTTESVESLAKGPKRGYRNISTCDLRYLRNKVFAFYGYPFKSPFIKAQFYFNGSPYKEDPKFSIKKISSDHQAYLEYLSKIEDWKSKIKKEREDGILDHENGTNDEYKFENSSLSPLAIDHHRETIIAKHKESHLLFLSFPDGIPKKRLKISFDPVDFSAILSPNGKYLAVKDNTDNNITKFIIRIINIEKAVVLPHVLQASFNEIISHLQFSKDSKRLLTALAEYDILTGKKIKEWTLPVLHNRYELLYMFSGIIHDGNILFGSMSSNKIYILDTNKNEFNVFLDFKMPGIVSSVGSISPDGNYLAGIVLKTKIEGTGGESRLMVIETKLTIWEIKGNSLNHLYDEVIRTYDANPANTIRNIKWSKEKPYLFVPTLDGLRRYYINPNNTIKKVFIQTKDNKGNVGGFFLQNFFIGTYDRLWDLETGRKFWPWHEVLDPLDKSNQLPLYDEHPTPVYLRD